MGREIRYGEQPVDIRTVGLIDRDRATQAPAMGALADGRFGTDPTQQAGQTWTDRLRLIYISTLQVDKAVLFSTAVTVAAFVPLFAIEGGRADFQSHGTHLWTGRQVTQPEGASSPGGEEAWGAANFGERSRTWSIDKPSLWLAGGTTYKQPLIDNAFVRL